MTVVTERESIESPVSPARMRSPSGRVARASRKRLGALAAREASSRPALRLATRLLPDHGTHQLEFYVECACGYQRHKVHGRLLRSRFNRDRADRNAEFLAAIEDSVCS